MAATNITITPRRTRVGRATIAYQVAGDGLPIVLIHGLSGSSRWWARNVRALAECFRVHVIDLVGFGDSRHGGRFVLGEAAPYLARWMDQLGIARAGLVGHSMGGYIAAELAADHPDRVERLVLVDAAALPFGQSLAWHLVSMAQELHALPPDFLPTLFYDALRAGPATLWDAANALLCADLRPKLGHIQAPTLVVWGERDAIVPLALGKQLSRHVRGKELLVIKGAGHNPMWDCPQAFNREVAAFLSGQSHPAEQHLVERSQPRPAIATAAGPPAAEPAAA
jgi:pimeloyl-ACP methyl ester carboxylesterase